MKSLGFFKFKKKNGKNKLRVEVFSTSRGGAYSPTSYYLKYRNRWVCPYEIRLYWERFPLLTILLKTKYMPLMADMIFHTNPLLEIIPKIRVPEGSSVLIPLKYT